MKHKTKKRPKWLKILLFCFFSILSLFLYSRYIGTSIIEEKEINVINSLIPEEFYGYKVIQISDIHYKTTIDKDKLNKIINKINKSKPNITVITGDLLDKNIKYTSTDYEYITKELNKIESEYKYIISGENDLCEEFKTIVKNTNFKLLDNTYEIIYNGGYDPILIGGISTSSDKKNINDKISPIENAIETENPKYKILIIHEPSIIDSIDYQKYDLILAGHTHNGQINLPFMKNILIPSDSKKYNKTMYTKNNTEIFISPGVGTTNIRARLFNRPTINLYRLKNK